MFKVIIRMDVRVDVSQMSILSVRISMSVRMSVEFECVVVQVDKSVSVRALKVGGVCI